MPNFEDKIQALMDEVYDAWKKEENKGKDKWEVLNGFSAAHQVAVVLGNFNYQVGNGGLEQWIYNGYFQDDSEKLTEYLEIGSESDERCRTILDRIYKLDHYANETDYDRYGYYNDPDNEDGESDFIGNRIDCDAFDNWYYANCGKDDWWKTVCGIIDKVEGHNLAPESNAEIDLSSFPPVAVSVGDKIPLNHEFSPAGDDYERDVGEDAPTSHLLRVYIENIRNENIGGFTMPLPAKKDELQPFLDGMEITEQRDMAIFQVYSDIKGLQEKVSEAIATSSHPNILSEINYLAARIESLSETSEMGFDIFRANIEAGRNCGSIAEMINLTFTENLNRFDVQPAFNEEMYGEFQIDYLLNDLHANAFNRLINSEDQSNRALAAHILRLESHVDHKAFGKTIVKEEEGVFTDAGYLTGGDGLQQLYKGIHEIPAEYRVFTPPMLRVEEAELTSLLIKIHAVGGEYMQRAENNLNKFMSEIGTDFLLLTNGSDIHLTRTLSAYYKGTSEHDKWANAANTPDTRAFALMPVISGADGVKGGLVEIDFVNQQKDILDNSIWFERVEAVKNNGIEQLYLRAEWEGLKANDIAGMVSWRHLYDKTELHALANHVSEIHKQRESASDKVVSVDEFLADLNKSYMERAESPKADMLRVTREAAAEILARGDADVFRLFPQGSTKLTPMDVVKTNNLWYASNREFAIRRDDIGGLDKWAERKTGDIARQAERSEKKKTNHAEL